MDPSWIISEDYQLIVKEYNWVKDFNIPLATSLDNIDAKKLDEFDLINTEIKSIQNYMSEKNGR